MAEIGRVLWVWFWYNQRPIPRTTTRWLATKLLLCIAGVLLQVMTVTLPDTAALAILVGTTGIVAILWVTKCLDVGFLTWTVFALSAAGILWVRADGFAPIFSLMLLMFGVMIFDITGGKAHNEAVERLPKLTFSSNIKTLVPGPALTCVWLWFGGNLDWWLVAPVAGFWFSVVHIALQKFFDTQDAQADPHRRT